MTKGVPPPATQSDLWVRVAFAAGVLSVIPRMANDARARNRLRISAR